MPNIASYGRLFPFWDGGHKYDGGSVCCTPQVNLIGDTTPGVGSSRKFPARRFDFKFTGTRGAGPSYIEKDVEKMRRWMLLSGASFYTWPHHDAAGLLTWSMLLAGMKLWSYVVPNDPETDAESAARQYVELVNAMDHISVDTENQLPDMATAHNLFLAPNTIL